MGLGLFKKKQEYADKVFFNAHIYTQDTGLPWAEAVAVKGQKILAVGHYEEMDSIINDETQLHDMEGKYILPGFIDIHRSPVMRLLEEAKDEVPDKSMEDEPEDRNPFDLKNLYAMELEDDQMAEEEAELEEDAETAGRGSGEAGSDEAEAGELEAGKNGSCEAGTDEGEAEQIDSGEIEVLVDEAGNIIGVGDAELSQDDEDWPDTDEVIGGDSEEGDALDDETVYYVDNSEFASHVKDTMDALSDHGVTTVLNLQTPDRFEEEFQDELINMYTNGMNIQRFYGSLFVNIPAKPLLVQAMLNKRRTRVTEIGDLIKNEVLYLQLDSEADRPQFRDEELVETLATVADRGFIIYIEALTHKDMLMAYQAVDVVRNKGYKNPVIIASEVELTDEEKSLLSFNATVFKSWANNVMSEGFFNGNVEDIEDAIDELTIYPAEMLGMEDKLGSIEKGKYADFAIFEENPLEASVRELSRMSAVMTVVNGEIVMDAQKANDDFMLEMMLHQQF